MRNPSPAYDATTRRVEPKHPGVPPRRDHGLSRFHRRRATTTPPPRNRGAVRRGLARS